MEIQLKSRNIPSFELIGKSSNICTVSTDTVVPDSSDDILRIVSSDYCCKIRSKDINNDKISIGGEIDAVIAYIPETGEGICTVSTQSSFETVFDVLGADGTCAVFADVKVIGFDCRIANPRKIHVQCEVAVFQECYKANEINVYSEYDELPECTYLKKEKSELLRISEVTEKTISIEEDIPMGETDGMKLISASSYFFIGEAEQIGEKLIVKGSCITDALFFDGKNIKNKSFKNDFSQLFNLMCTAEKSVFRVNVLPTGEYYELQDNYFVMDIRAVVELVCYDKTEIKYYADAYSTKCDLQIEHCSLEAVKSLRIQNLKLNDTVKYTSGDNISGIISARVHNTELRFSDVGISLPYTVDIVYLTPSHQFPTGVTTSFQNRLRLLNWAEQKNGYIIENDYDSEFLYGKRILPSLQALDKNNRVIYLGTLSKAISPSIRCAYYILPPPLLELYEKKYKHFNSALPTFVQKSIAEFINDGHLDKHIRRISSMNERKYGILINYLKKNLPEQVHMIYYPAGSHILIQVDCCHSENDLTEFMRQRFIGIHGTQKYWMGENAPDNVFILGFSSIPTEKIEKYAAILTVALHEYIQSKTTEVL